jgi:hypothetical protein
MNIFVTNDDPVLAARDLCDQHVRSKMQIEGAIMLAHAFPQELLDHPSTPKTQSGKSRKSGKGYAKHQCSIWARETKANFEWLTAHTLEMFTERMYRWSNSNEHFTKTFIQWCSKNIHNITTTKTELTPYAVAINVDCNCRKLPGFNQLSVIEQYRSYIIHDKEFATWTNRSEPTWYNQSQFDPMQYS